MRIMQSRRGFAACASAAGVASLVGGRPSRADEEPPETPSIRLPRIPGICIAPEYVAEDLLRAEGFTDIRYVDIGGGTPNAQLLARGELDFAIIYLAAGVPLVDAGEAVSMLAGVHPGCFELFAAHHIARVTDLRGKSVGVPSLGSAQHLFLASIAAYVGLDPSSDIHWVTGMAPKPMQLFAEGRIDAFLGFPPEPQELRERGIGHVIVNSTLDRPWAQYYCCLLAGHRPFVQANPAATKRVVRAVLKATDLCADEPERVARRLVQGGFTASHAYALQSLQEVPYRAWRDYDPEDAVRFYALRLHEAGVVKSSPARIIADGTDWRFLNELKRELKV
jgi:NitT/TauT family transport system substrate-binding protein